MTHSVQNQSFSFTFGNFGYNWSSLTRQNSHTKWSPKKILTHTKKNVPVSLQGDSDQIHDIYPPRWVKMSKFTCGVPL